MKKLLLAALAGVCLMLLGAERTLRSGEMLDISLPVNSTVAMGELPGWSSVHKFGYNTDVDTGTDPEDMWSCPTLAAGAPELYPLQTTPYTLYASSDDENDAAKVLQVSGLAGDYTEQSASVTLGADTGTGGTTMAEVGSGLTWIIVHRAFIDGADALVGNVWLNPDNTDAGGDGVPDVLTNLQGCILIEDGQTEQAIYMVPDGKTAYLDQLCMGTSSTLVTAEVLRLQFFSKLFGKAARVQFKAGQTNGAGYPCKDYPVPISYPERTLLFVRIAETASNNAAGYGTFDLRLRDTP